MRVSPFDLVLIIHADPVADMTDEHPYEKVNGLNNVMVPHGLCRYVKSIFIGRAQDEITPKTMDRWLVLSSDNSPVQYSVFHEYFPGGKISSVPEDATAYIHRKKTSHALAMAVWTDNTPENLEAAKKGVHELIQPSIDLEAVPEELGYSNYSQCYPVDSVLDLTDVWSMTGGEADSSANQLLFGENYPRLQKIKRKYDPEGLFNKWYNISDT